MNKRIIFTVTNDLNFDQRMQRIAGSLAAAGYDVCLVGVKKKNSPPLLTLSFHQKRIPVWFEKGKLFYLEYMLKLFCWLLFQRAQILCAIDLDTILPVYLVSKMRGIPRVYDAHELFCEMKEVVSRPMIYKTWKKIEAFCVPRFRIGYTVNEPIAHIFEKDYGVRYGVIRNVPKLSDSQFSLEKEPFLVYQGAVNEGRLFEVLIPAMQYVQLPLHIYGDGNFLDQTRELISRYGLQDKVLLKGKLSPSELKLITARASLGFTLFEDRGLSNYYSLANRFFDYVHAGTPQLAVDFPVYRQLNRDFPVAVLINTTDPAELAAAINNLLQDRLLYKQLQENCLKMRQEWNWEKEEKALLAIYQSI
ncbi:glycosyltransferase [Flavihumibacter cheonanensis]|uniref:glycosyltransferase n=1 Tax=Flavihumibacter cheonanensis TaxID=1442385 RepID=UPI001EF7A8A9|nr:glycosyltransferase [Flavihumibacter cheonanensis]MCG7751611.1 glycosyltransferase [Flavihumibacter cheonanensis]